MYRCEHNTTIFRTASSVTIADVSWRISSAVHRGTSSAASASKYVSIYTMRTSFIDNQFKMATVNIFQLYQKTCSVCQCAITKDCVEGNGKFYHSNCIKVSTDYRDSLNMIQCIVICSVWTVKWFWMDVTMSLWATSCVRRITM